MIIQKFSVNNHPIQTLLSWVISNEIAIPEIQRPFVWDASKVRDLIDSLYKGFPIGYIIAWQNPAVRLKDGSSSKGKKILIDGQQRISALMAAILGKEIIDKDYQRKRIVIAFNPDEMIFEVSNPAIQKDKRWIADISKIFAPEFKLLDKLKEYCTNNPEMNEEKILNAFDSLKSIINIPVGLIELSPELEISEITEIFIRINSSGVTLNQADFAMSKIAVDDRNGGNLLRKAIDYFCHLAVEPEFIKQLKENDKEFTSTDYFQKMSWLKDDRDDIYDPSYTDMLRVSFTSKFHRGQLQDLVALLSGRDFETRHYKEEIAEQAFNMLREGVLNFMNETHFKKFVMIVRSAGFIDSSMIRSQNALNFAYILYLTLRELNYNQAKIEQLVRKWFVLSVLTSRYSGSPESQFNIDIRRVYERLEEYINNVISAELSDTYWTIALPQSMDTSLASSPIFNVFLAAQVKMNDKGFLSKDITVKDLLELKGDIHHIYPKNYLKKQNYNRGMYNQIGNYVMAQSEINIAIGDKEPEKYFSELKKQCETQAAKYGAIIDIEQLKDNLKDNCIPLTLLDGTPVTYEDFLKERRNLMANKIRNYFELL
ncbi:MAG: GmrSD restriction endonuclease domain-containing protein [Spirochaetota bacterium]